MSLAYNLVWGLVETPNSLASYFLIQLHALAEPRDAAERAEIRALALRLPNVEILHSLRLYLTTPASREAAAWETLCEWALMDNLSRGFPSDGYRERIEAGLHTLGLSRRSVVSS